MNPNYWLERRHRQDCTCKSGFIANQILFSLCFYLPNPVRSIVGRDTTGSRQPYNSGTLPLKLIVPQLWLLPYPIAKRLGACARNLVIGEN